MSSALRGPPLTPSRGQGATTEHPVRRLSEYPGATPRLRGLLSLQRFQFLGVARQALSHCVPALGYSPLSNLWRSSSCGSACIARERVQRLRVTAPGVIKCSSGTTPLSLRFDISLPAVIHNLLDPFQRHIGFKLEGRHDLLSRDFRMPPP